MKKNSEILYEIALKLVDDSVLFEHSMSTHSVYGMLAEDINDSDIEKLRKAVLVTTSAVDQNLKTANDLKLASLADYFGKLKGSLSKAANLTAKLDLSDADGVAAQIKSFFGKKMDVSRALQAVIDLQNKSNTAGNTLASAVELISKNLEGKVEDDVNLGSLDPDKHGISSDDLRSGVSKAFKNSKPKGFMAKLGSLLGKSKFVASIPGAEQIDNLPVDKLADELLTLTFGELKSFNLQVQKTSQAAEKAKVPVDVVQGVHGSAEEAPPPGKESEGGPVTASLEPPEGEGESESEDSGSEPPPEDPESESDPASDIKAIAAETQSKPMSPKDAISKALSDWESSLSSSSQKTLQSKGRSQELKDGIFTGIDKGKAAVQKAVARAVKTWRAAHEETLIKSKRFAKKNFDSLEELIPSLAAQVLAQTSEARQKKIAVSEIRKFVYKKLDAVFLPQNKLHETWQKNAGLLKD